MILITGFVFFAWLRDAGDPLRQFTISAETTGLLEPVDELGLIDYVAVVRQQHLEEMQSPENAAGILVEAVGPLVFEETWEADQAYEQLGLQPLPVPGNYFIPWDEVIARTSIARGEVPEVRKREINEVLPFYSHRIWQPDAVPELAEWVRLNEGPLERVIEASRCSGYCGPLLVEPGDALTEYRFPLLHRVKEMNRLLAVRAMLRLKNDDARGAWDDLHAALRLARLTSQGYLRIDHVHAASNFAVAASVLPELMSSPGMSRALFQQIQDDWRSLPPWGDLAAVLDTTLRYETLDLLQRGARLGTNCWSSSCIWKIEGYSEDPLAQHVMNALVDWDSIMVSGNSWHDRLVAISKEADPSLRDAAFDAFRADLQELCHLPWHSIPNTVNVGNRAMWSLIAGNDLSARDILVERATFDSLAETMFAIEEFRYSHTALPRSLQDLNPDYLSTVPRDPYTPTDALRFSAQGPDAYVLYSVGPCGGDDGGLTEYGDISFRVRMPVPEWLEPKPEVAAAGNLPGIR